ncbi:hypothetical protein SNEBB_008854, partial [Seison nebaliae]
ESFADISIISGALPLPDISGSTRSRSTSQDQPSKSVVTQPSKATSTPTQKANTRVRFTLPNTSTINSLPVASRSSNHVKIDHKIDSKRKSKKADPSKKPANKRKNSQRSSCSAHQLIIIPPRLNRPWRSSVLVCGFTTATKAVEIKEFLSTKGVRPVSIARLLPKAETNSQFDRNLAKRSDLF